MAATRRSERAGLTLPDALARLEALGTEAVRARNRAHGADGAQFGVRLGDIRTVAAAARGDHALALALWATENLDARLLAVLLLEPRALAPAELDALVREGRPAQLADWLTAYVVKKHPAKEALRQAWLADADPWADPWAARAGWALTAERIARAPDGLDLPALLDRLEAELGGAPPAAQWTMNACLAAIGIHAPEHRARALALGEALGLYRDYPVSKGCTSPFAPAWIAEMVRRQG